MRFLPLTLLAALPAPVQAQDLAYEARVLADAVEATPAASGAGIESLELPLSSGGEADGEIAIHCRSGEEPWINLLVDREQRFLNGVPATTQVAQSMVDVTTDDMTLGGVLVMFGPAEDPGSTAMLKVQGQRAVLTVLDAFTTDGLVRLNLGAPDPRPFGTAILTLPQDPDLRDRMATLSEICAAP